MCEIKFHSNEPKQRCCVKCGGEDLCITFTRKDSQCKRANDNVKDCPFKEYHGPTHSWSDATITQEFLAVHCRTCQYDWAEDCLDRVRDEQLKASLNALHL